MLKVSIGVSPVHPDTSALKGPNITAHYVQENETTYMGCRRSGAGDQYFLLWPTIEPASSNRRPEGLFACKGHLALVGKFAKGISL